MDEQLLAERLAGIGRHAQPPPGLVEHILRDAARRNRRYRVVTAAVATCLLLAGTATAVRMAGLPHRHAPSGAAATVGLTLRPGPAPHLSTLAELFPGRRPLTVSRTLRDGEQLWVFAVTPAGALVGADRPHPVDGGEHWTRTVVLDPVNGDERDLPAAGAPLFTSDGRYLTQLGQSPDFVPELFCTDLRTGTARRLSTNTFVATNVVTGDGRTAWTLRQDPGDAPEIWISTGCGSPRPLAVQGFPIALHAPYLYLFDAARQPLRYDLASGATQVLPLGHPLSAGGGTSVAISPSTVFWTPLDKPAGPGEVGAPGAIRARDIATGLDTVVTAVPPRARPRAPDDEMNTLTAGGRLMAWSSSPYDGNLADSQGLVYDPVTNSLVRLPGEAFAAGNWLVWYENGGYRVLDVS
jgi:hypothetical protein